MRSDRQAGRMGREELLRDLKIGIRSLRGSPVYAASLLVTLAIAIGISLILVAAVEAGLRHPEPLDSPSGLRLPLQTAAALGTGGTPTAEPGGGIIGFDAPRLMQLPQTIGEAQVEALRGLLLIVRAAVLLMLALACINLVLLLTSHASARRRELLIRTVLGAHPRRLVSQLAVETATVLAIAVFAGTALAGLGLLVLRGRWPAGVTQWLSPLELHPFAVVAATVPLFVVAIATLLPGARMGSAWLGEAAGSAAHATASRTERRLRDRLSAASVAGSVVLLTGTGLLTFGFGAEAIARDPGYDPSDTLALSLRVPAAYAGDAEVRTTYLEAMLSGVGAIPGIGDAAVASQGAELGLGTTGLVHALTGVPVRPGILLPARHHAVSPGYFAAMRIPVVSGREFTRADRAYTDAVVVVNETFAHRFFPRGDPIGKYVHLGRLTLEPEWYLVVGIVGDVAAAGLGVSAEPPAPAIYFSSLQVPPEALTLTARAADPLEAGEAIERTIRFIEPAQRFSGPRLLTDVLEDSAAPLRWSGLLFGAVAGFGLILAAAGVYGVISFNVARRSKEIGIRIALGSPPRRVLRLVLLEAGRLTLRGLVLGLLGAICLARLLQYLFHGVDPFDPLVYITVVALLGTAALAAGWLPARAAAALDPAVTLREYR